MQNYKKIEYYNKGTFGENILAFNKLDGNQMRCEYDKKHSKLNKNNGFNKFGTRKTLINSQNNEYGEAIDLFMNKYSEDIDRIFRTDNFFRDIQKYTVYFEYYGPNSFAGWHDPNDEMTVTIFDIEMFNKGMLIPKLFVKMFGDLEIPEVVYEGTFNKSLIQDVKNNTFNLKEGVVCKGYNKIKGNDVVWMVKIKCSHWLDRLKGKMGDDFLLKELNGDKSLL